MKLLVELFSFFKKTTLPVKLSRAKQAPVPLHGFGHEEPSGLISDPDLIHPSAIICGFSYIY
jgi:hypothetical protein